jgi:hypothetical protein
MWNSDDFDRACVKVIVLCMLIGGALAVVLPWVWHAAILPLLRVLVA